MGKKSLKRWFAILVVFCMLFTNTGLVAFAGTDSEYFGIDSKDELFGKNKDGSEYKNPKPPSLAPGQIWTDKSVDASNAMPMLTFGVTLKAWGAVYSADGETKNPLNPDNNTVTVIDDLGAFTFDKITGDLPDDIKYTISGSTITWRIPEAYILGDKPFEIKYTVTLEGKLAAGVPYETGTAKAVFEPQKYNPYYYVGILVQQGAFTNDSISWNNGNGINEGTITDTVLDPKGVTISFGGSVKNNTELPKVISDPLELPPIPANAVWYDIDITIGGVTATYKWHIQWNKNLDADGNKYCYITVKDLDGPGFDVIYQIVFPNKGGNTGVAGKRVTLPPPTMEYLHQSGFTWIGDSVEAPLLVYGQLVLKRMAAPLTIIKTAAAVTAPIEGQSFEITVSFSGEGIELLKDEYTDRDVTAKRKEGTNDYTISLKVGDRFTFDDLPLGIFYTVSEKPEDYFAPANITNGSGIFGGEAFVTVENKKFKPGLSVTKTVVIKNDGDEQEAPADKTYTAGDTVIYKISVKNTGDMPLRNVKWTEGWNGAYGELAGPFWSYTAASSDTGKFTPRAEGYRLGIGSSINVYYAYTVPADAGLGDIQNTVGASGKDPLNNDVSDSDSAGITLEHPDLVITKEIVTGEDTYADSHTLNSGSNVLFLITVENRGGAAAKNVSLTDLWYDGLGNTKNLALAPVSLSINPGDFDVAPGNKVYFEAVAEDLLGMDAGQLQEELTRLIEGLSELIKANQSFIDGKEAATESALAAVFAAFSQDLLDIYLFEYEAVPESVWEIEGFLIDYGVDMYDYPDLFRAIEEYNDTVSAYGEAAIAAAHEVIKAAEGDIKYLEEKGLSYEATLVRASNTVTYSYSYGSGSSTVDVNIEPDGGTSLKIKKEVSLDEENWYKSVIMDHNGGTAHYRVTIENTGVSVMTVSLVDSNVAGDPEWQDITIGPGGKYTVSYSAEIGGNDGYIAPRLVPNIATVSFGDDSLSSSTLVTVLPAPFAELVIDKKVARDGWRMLPRWSSSLSLYSDSPVNVTYRVTLMNIGTADAEFTLTDELNGELSPGAFYTNLACTAPYTGYNADGTITLRPLGILTLYYKAALDNDPNDPVVHKNVAAYAITSDNTRRDRPTTGSDSAQVEIIPVPSVSLLLEKSVVNARVLENYGGGDWNGFLEGLNWSTEAAEANKSGSGDFLFRIAVTNNGNMAAEVKLADIMENDEQVYSAWAGTWGDDFTELFGEYAEYVLIVPGETQIFYIEATVTVNSGEDSIKYRNIAGITDVIYELPAGYNASEFAPEINQENNFADVSVIKTNMPVVGLSITKQVRTVAGTWEKEAEFTGGSAEALFKITVEAKPRADKDNNLKELPADYTISGNITDTFDGDAVTEDFSGAFTLNADNDWTQEIYYTAKNLTAGEYKNVALIEDFDFDEKELLVIAVKDKDEADVIIKAASPVVPGPGTTEPGEPGLPITTIIEQEVPLATLREEMIILNEDDVPLSDIPQTGVNEAAFSFLMLGLSLSALLALAFARRREEN